MADGQESYVGGALRPSGRVPSHDDHGGEDDGRAGGGAAGQAFTEEEGTEQGGPARSRVALRQREGL